MTGPSSADLALLEAIAAVVDERTAPLRARLEALERERGSRHAPSAVLSVRALSERHPGFTEESIRALVKRRHRNGLQDSGAIIRQGRRVLIHERRFVTWAESLAETKRGGRA